MKRLLASLLLAILSFATVHAAPLSIEEATDPSGMLTAKLSPDGKHIAAIIYNGNNYRLVLIDTVSLKVTKLSDGAYAETGYYRYHKAPRRVFWAGKDLLAVDYGIDAETIDLSGKPVANLGDQFVRVIETGPNAGKVLVKKNDLLSDLALCDPRTAECKRFDQPSGKPIKWAFDRRGELRAVTVVDSALLRDVSTVSNWYKPAATDQWVKLAEFKPTDDYWMPVYVPDEPDTIVVNSRIGRDTYALFNYDAKNKRQGDMLVGHPTQDILSFKGIDEEAFNYVATEGMRPQQVWFDPPWAQMQGVVDKLLPNRVNVISGNPAGAMLIYSYADVDPGTWYLFDVVNKRLTVVGKAKSQLDTSKLRPMEIMRYQAADGLTIPAYLTRPGDSKGPGPLVVLVHGGPIARDKWEFNAEVQLLASRGYLVFQPQFRGSSGFGRAFEQAGYRQWGRAMQDDITSGVDHLVKQGIADPGRICIVGASYGGYAALWGLIKTPNLYRCGVSFAGVTDIAYMFSDWSDASLDKVSRHVMASRIGSEESRAELFDPVSPLKHAAKIEVPVLLMHGDGDVRVPISHGKKMRDALERNKKQVSWLSFEEEGHTLRYVQNKHTYYKTMLSFLGAHLAARKEDKEAQQRAAPAP